MSRSSNVRGDDNDEFEITGLSVSLADLKVLHTFCNHVNYNIRYLNSIIFRVIYNTDTDYAIGDHIDVEHTPIFNYDTNKFVKIEFEIDSLDDISYE